MNAIDPNGLIEFLPAEVTDDFFRSLEDAKNKGYYNCLSNCLAGGLLSPLVGLGIKEGLIATAEHAGLPGAISNAAT